VCSLSSIEDAFTTGVQETVADSLGATPVLTESGGAIAGEDRGLALCNLRPSFDSSPWDVTKTLAVEPCLRWTVAIL